MDLNLHRNRYRVTQRLIRIQVVCRCNYARGRSVFGKCYILVYGSPIAAIRLLVA